MDLEALLGHSSRTIGRMQRKRIKMKSPRRIDLSTLEQQRTCLFFQRATRFRANSTIDRRKRSQADDDGRLF